MHLLLHLLLIGDRYFLYHPPLSYCPISGPWIYARLILLIVSQETPPLVKLLSVENMNATRYIRVT